MNFEQFSRIFSQLFHSYLACINSIKLSKVTKNSKRQRRRCSVQNNLATSDFKLIKAIQFYENGQFADSLKAFRGYAKDSDDVSGLRKAVSDIFWSESRKIYGRAVPSGPGGYRLAMLVTAAVCRHDDVSETSPDFLVRLIDTASDKAQRNLGQHKVAVYLNLGNYDKAIETSC